MVAHLFWHDVKRNLKARRVFLLLGLALCLAYKKVGEPREWCFADLPGVLSRHHYWLFEVIPLVAGLMGASLAHERRTGIALTILARGVSRGQYLLAKMLGAAASSALFTLMTIGGFYALLAILSLPEHEILPDNPTIQMGEIHSYYWLPVENLVVHDIFAALMLIAATAALSLVGVLAGLIMANEYVAMASPPIFTILATILTRNIADGLNPEEYIGLYYARIIPQRLVLIAPFLYWGGFSLLIAALGKRIIATKELA